MSSELHRSDNWKSNTNEYAELSRLDTTKIPPIHKGKLKKRHPRNRKKYQDRWLYLFKDRIVYYKEEMGIPSGEIHLENSRAEIRTDERNAFEVCYDDMFKRRYQFVAKTDVDRAVWVWKLNCRSYLQYGRTRRPLNNTTVTYLHETMGIDQIKKLVIIGYKAAIEYFLSSGANGSGKLQKDSSLDSELSTSSEEKAYRATLTDSDYANLDDYKDDDEVVLENLNPEEEQTFRVLPQDAYFDPRQAQDNEKDSQLLLSLNPTLSRQRQVFSRAEVMSSEGKTVLPVTDANDESVYLDQDSVNSILDILHQNEKAEENPYTVLPDLDDNDIIPLPEKDISSDHGQNPVHLFTNAFKKVILAPCVAHGPPTITNRSAERQYNAEDVIKVKCVGQRDFIEVDVCEIGTTYDSLLRCFSEEFELSTEDILLVRKLPDILVRCDKDVRRIHAKQEFELELRK